MLADVAVHVDVALAHPTHEKDVGLPSQNALSVMFVPTIGVVLLAMSEQTGGAAPVWPVGEHIATGIEGEP